MPNRKQYLEKSLVASRDLTDAVAGATLKASKRVATEAMSGVATKLVAASSAVAGAVSGPALTTSGVQALGFQGGILAGTPATAIMSLYGGSVPAGSCCAVLQSIGAVGLGVGGTVVAAGVGGFVAYKITSSLLGGNQPSDGSKNNDVPNTSGK